MTRKMKDSGVEWIGEIPEEWEIKNISKIAKVTSSKRVFEESYSDTGIPFYRSKEIVQLSNGEEISSEIYIPDEVFEECNIKSKAPKKDDMLLTSIGTIGKTWISDGRKFYYKDGNLTQIESNENNNTKYIEYCFKSNLVFEQYNRLSAGSTLLALTIEKIKKIILTYPPLDKQKMIVSYLDKKCKKIDETIEKEKQVIEKLKAYKQSVITEAVTKGLNPDVQMKESGIEWIGEIPEHWNLIRLRYIAKCQNGISKSAEFFGTGFPFVSYGDVYKNIVLPELVEGLVESTESDRKAYSVEEGDIFFTRTSETIEEIGLTCVCEKTIENATFAGFLIRVRPFMDNLVLNFSKYYFSSNVHRRFFVKEMNLVTRASLSQELLKKLPVLMPPIEEQDRIANYLDNKCSKIDDTISKKETLIQKLTDYRKSLIYECVTGKREV